MVGGFAGLLLDPVVSGNDKNDDIGRIRPPRAQGGEGGVAGGVDETDVAPAAEGDEGGADVLGDPAGLLGRMVALADGVQNRGLAVVDMAHDGDDRRARGEVRFFVGRPAEPLFHIALADPAHAVAVFGDKKLGGVGINDIIAQHIDPEALEGLDDILGPLGHAQGKLLHRKGLRHHDLAHDPRPLLEALQVAGPLALALAPHGGERTHAALVFLAGQRLGDGQAARAAARFIALLGPAAGGAGLLAALGLAATLLLFG